MAGLGTHFAIERVKVGNYLPKVVRACALLDPFPFGHRAGLDKAMRDVILGHSLKGMDAYYLKPTDQDLTEALVRYTVWLDEEIASTRQGKTVQS